MDEYTPRRVWVLCQNDFPVGVVTTHEAAEDWRREKKRANALDLERDSSVRWCAYHVHSFLLDEGEE